jgi:uncharacterized protein (TIGR03083 family)
MDREEKWRVIADQRRLLAELLDGVEDAGWEHPSLCSAWRVRDVAAHVALTPQSPGLLRILGRAVSARGDFDAVNRDLAVEHADRPGVDLVSELRHLADDRRKPAITTLDNLLFDTLVHVQDIAVPLRRPASMPIEAACEGAERVWRMGWPFWAQRRLRGLQLRATDVAWTVGSGDEVRGPVRALLLLVTGRTEVALLELDGPGTRRLVATVEGTA